MKASILLAEDERNIAVGIVYNLEKHGFEVQHVPTGTLALEAALGKPFDLIVLDVMMPGLTGFEVCKALRSENIVTPILMLTARQEVEKRIEGLKAGADDYLGKPFSMEELLVRIEALLRRKTWNEDAAKGVDTVSSNAPCKIKGLDFNPKALTLETQQLTAIEAKLLLFLITESGNTLTRAEILEKVWGLKAETQTRTLDNFIMRLRQRLEAAGGSGEWIESVRGVGYRLKV